MFLRLVVVIILSASQSRRAKRGLGVPANSTTDLHDGSPPPPGTRLEKAGVYVRSLGSGAVPLGHVSNLPPATTVASAFCVSLVMSKGGS